MSKPIQVTEKQVKKGAKAHKKAVKMLLTPKFLAMGRKMAKDMGLSDELFKQVIADLRKAVKE